MTTGSGTNLFVNAAFIAGPISIDDRINSQPPKGGTTLFAKRAVEVVPES
jgi:hypothetical protein